MNTGASTNRRGATGSAAVQTVLVVPGLHGSGPQHWQSWFEREIPGAQRVNQDHWDKPDLVTWAGRLEAAIDAARGPVWVVAHSFGCLVTAHLLPRCRDRLAGVMLVAPADPDKFGVSAHIPLRPFDIPSVVVASTNDPWVRFLRAAWLADCWGSRLINLGAAGHVNTDAGFGPWPEGLAIFQRLRQAAEGTLNGGFEDLAQGGLPRLDVATAELPDASAAGLAGAAAARPGSR